MERLCYTFNLIPGKEEEYELAHAHIWPEAVNALQAAGIENYSLFRRGTQVIAYGECDESIEKSLAYLDADEGNRRWKTFIGQLFTRAFNDDGSFLVAEEIWRLP